MCSTDRRSTVHQPRIYWHSSHLPASLDYSTGYCTEGCRAPRYGENLPGQQRQIRSCSPHDPLAVARLAIRSNGGSPLHSHITGGLPPRESPPVSPDTMRTLRGMSHYPLICQRQARLVRVRCGIYIGGPPRQIPSGFLRY